MAPGHLPGHSRMEEKVSLMEDNACDSFVPEDISPFPLLFHQDALTSFSGYLGGGGGPLLCARIPARGYCAPIRSPALPTS